MTTLCLHSGRNSLYMLTAQSLHQLSQLHQVWSAKQRAPRRQLHQRIFCHHISLTGRNRNQMLALPVEVDSVLTPGMEVGDELILLTEPRVKRVGDCEASIQTVLIGRS